MPTRGSRQQALEARSAWRALIPHGFGRQVSWSLLARVMAAGLQVLIFLLLARGLPPPEFALVSTAYVLFQVVVALNGFGLLRQIQYRRSLDPDDPALPSLFAVRLVFTYMSSLLWLAVFLVIYMATGQLVYVALAIVAVRLLIEQTTQVWNSISIADGDNYRLVPSYFLRRFPVVVALLVALWLDWDIPWAWSVGLCVGGVLSYLEGARTQEAWARVWWPRGLSEAGRPNLDFGYWWAQIGDQVRDLDVASVALVSSVDAGLYALPARLVRPMNLVTQTTASVAFPWMVRNDAMTRRRLLMSTSVAALPVGVMAGAMAALAPLVPELVSHAYDGSVATLQILCLSAFLAGVSTWLLTFLQSRSGTVVRTAGVASLVAGAGQVVFAAVGAVAAGAPGAAWAAVATQLALVVFLGWHAARACGDGSRRTAASAKTDYPAGGHTGPETGA